MSDTMIDMLAFVGGFSILVAVIFLLAYAIGYIEIRNCDGVDGSQ